MFLKTLTEVIFKVTVIDNKVVSKVYSVYQCCQPNVYDVILVPSQQAIICLRIVFKFRSYYEAN